MGRKAKALDDWDALFKAAEDRLVELVPPLAVSLDIRKPVYCLRLWYYEGGSDGGRLPSLLLVPEAYRRKALTAWGDKAPHYLWCADELTGRTAAAHTAETVDPPLSDLMQRWHTRPGFGEGAEELQPVREMVQRAAARLNRYPWADHLPVTDDFVVFGADGTHEFLDDHGDLVASVPSERVELLRSRGMLGPTV